MLKILNNKFNKGSKLAYFMKTDKELYEHYRGQVMLLKHIADSIDGAEFNMKRSPEEEYCWDIGNICWNENYTITFPNLDYAPTNIGIELMCAVSGDVDEIGTFDNDSVHLTHELYGIRINGECYFENIDFDYGTLLEVIILEREKLKQTEQAVLEEKLTYDAYNPYGEVSRAIQKDLIDEPDAPIVKLYSQIEYLNNIEKIILEFEDK